MTQSIPFIRAGTVAPIRRWLRENGRDPAPLFAQVDLDWIPESDPLRPIPLSCAIRLLVKISQDEGPDAPYRIAAGRSLFEIGLIGQEGLHGTTLRDGFHRMARAMPYHCSHELFTVSDTPAGLQIGQGWMAVIGDIEALHAVQQFFLGFVDAMCALAAGPPPCVSRVGIVPHPEVGLAHLTPWFGNRIRLNDLKTLDIEIADALADLPIPAEVRASAIPTGTETWPCLRTGETLADDVRTLIVAMLPQATPTLHQVARIMGVSTRTLQLWLRKDGRTFSEILDLSRAQIAITRLTEPNAPSLKDLTKVLGYSDQATLTRAMKRWTGKLPSDFGKYGPV